MWKNRKNLKRVETWNDTSVNDGITTLSSLQKAFEVGTQIIEGEDVYYLFSDIWIPLGKRDPVTHEIINGEYEYHNVGVSMGELTDIYNTEYRSLFLASPLDKTDNTTILADALKLGKIIKSVLLKNRWKYLKWIDTMGYAYNPLWNVDGTELYQSLDNHGEVKTSRSPILQTSELNQVTTDADGTLRNAEKTSMGYNNTAEEVVTGLKDITQEEHEHAKNLVNGENVDYSVGAKDAAFGTALTGGDYMHVEKRLRQGNIGVTMTSQLIEAERELVRFNLIQEFFNDINKEILIGIYI